MKKLQKSIVSRCDINNDLESVLNESFIGVKDFLNISLVSFRKMLYNQDHQNLPSRTIALLSKRFGDTVLKNDIIPFDKSTGKVVKNDCGKYELHVSLQSQKKVGRSNWTVIPFARKDNLYFEDLIDGWRGAGILFKKGSNVYVVFTVEVESKCTIDYPAVLIGIDLNWEKNAVSIYDPETDEYIENFFFDCSSYTNTLNQLQNSLNRIQKRRSKSRYRTDWSKEMHEEVNKIHRRRVGTIKNLHGNFVSNLLKKAEKYIDTGVNVIFVIEDLSGINRRTKHNRTFNRWLSSEWSYARLKNILELKGYPVRAVYPINTSKMCHKCGSIKDIKMARVYNCDNCGLELNRDLNAARNIARRGYNYYNKKWKR